MSLCQALLNSPEVTWPLLSCYGQEIWNILGYNCYYTKKIIQLAWLNTKQFHHCLESSVITLFSKLWVVKIVLSNEFDEMMLANAEFTRKIMTDNITTYNIPESNFLEDASLSCFEVLIRNYVTAVKTSFYQMWFGNRFFFTINANVTS